MKSKSESTILEHLAERAAAHPGALEFDRAVLGLTDPELQSHVERCAGCMSRLTALRDEQAAFAASDEPARAARAIARRLEARRKAQWWRRKWSLAAIVVAAATCGAFLVVADRSEPGDTRIKGGPVLLPYVKRGSADPQPLAPGATLRQGDAVQFAYQAAGYPKIVLFSVDAGCTPRLEHRGDAAERGVIPVSFHLDAAGGGGRVYATFSHEQERVTAAALGAALRSAPGGCNPDVAPPLDGPTFVARGLVLRERLTR